MIFSLDNFGAKQLGSYALITAGSYRKVEEKYRSDSVKIAGRNSATVKSYDNKLDN